MIVSISDLECVSLFVSVVQSLALFSFQSPQPVSVVAARSLSLSLHCLTVVVPHCELALWFVMEALLAK